MPNPEDIVDDAWDDEGADGVAGEVPDAWDEPAAEPDLVAWDEPEAEPDLVAETQAEMGGAGDFVAGAIDGALMNYAGEIGQAGERIGNLWADMLQGDYSRARDEGVNPFDDAQQTSLGTTGNMLGNVASGTVLGLATGGLGGIGTQAAIQGGAGAVAGYGANHDPYEALMSGGIGALFGGAGRAVAGKVAPAANQLDEVLPPVRPPSAEYLPGAAPDPSDLAGAGMNWLDEGQGVAGAADEALPPVWNEGPEQPLLAPQEAGWLEKYGKKALDWAGGNPIRRPDRWLLAQGAKKLLPGAPKKLGTMARTPEVVKDIMGNVGGASALTGQRLQARPDLPTLVWGLQSVNASGDTGLPQKAQEKLDAALASGDDSNVSSVYMSLSMAYPAFQKRMQQEIESINDEGE